MSKLKCHYVQAGLQISHMRCIMISVTNPSVCCTMCYSRTDSEAFNSESPCLVILNPHKTLQSRWLKRGLTKTREQPTTQEKIMLSGMNEWTADWKCHYCRCLRDSSYATGRCYLMVTNEKCACENREHVLQSRWSRKTFTLREASVLQHCPERDGRLIQMQQQREAGVCQDTEKNAHSTSCAFVSYTRQTLFKMPLANSVVRNS